jgi:hypothetical protein
MKYLLCLLPLVAGCATGTVSMGLSSAEPTMPTDEVALPSDGIRLVWEEGEEARITDLLEEYVRVTGDTVVYTGETRTQVTKKRIHMVAAETELEVPPEGVIPVVEALLAHHQFVFIPLHDAEPRLVALISLETQERNQVKRSSRFVAIEDIDQYAKRRGVLITTSLTLPNTDVRTLSNSMRQMLTDANTQQIIPVGNSNSLILTGFGSDVCALVTLLRRVDAASKSAQQGETR